MTNKTITLSFDLEQVCNDILAKCNLISIGMKDEALDDIRANIQDPDSPETRSIINRAITEAFGDVKRMCQRYLRTGRTSDNNMLERIVSNVVYVNDEHGDPTDEIDHLVYEVVTLVLEIPNFNTSVTDPLKNGIHRYVVDYAMGSFLEDQHSEKATDYMTKAATKDKSDIRACLNSRESYNVRKPSWI